MFPSVTGRGQEPEFPSAFCLLPSAFPDKVKQEVSQSAGWILITSKDNSVATLLETGRRMQRLFLKVREKSIAIHPMTQILEEASTKQTLNQSIGISENIQFILRSGYLKSYPSPVSLRRPVDWFIRK